MCLSWTNTSLYYINCSLLSLYSRLDISFNHSTQFVSRTVTLCPPKWCDRGSSLCLSLADNITFCIPVRDYPLYLVEPSSHDLVHHRNWSPDKTSPWTNYCACRLWRYTVPTGQPMYLQNTYSTIKRDKKLSDVWAKESPGMATWYIWLRILQHNASYWWPWLRWRCSTPTIVMPMLLMRCFNVSTNLVSQQKSPACGMD